MKGTHAESFLLRARAGRSNGRGRVGFLPKKAGRTAERAARTANGQAGLARDVRPTERMMRTIKPIKTGGVGS